MPCNVVLRNAGEDITVEFMDPASVLSLVDRVGIETIAAEVRQRLETARDAIAG